MKKIAIIALAILAGASFSTADAAKKKDKKQTVVPEAVVLNNGSDTLSYVCGKYMTEGLLTFIQQQGVDSLHLADFIAGFKEAAYNMDPKTKAHIVGTQIANQLIGGMLPRMQKEFTQTADTIVMKLLLRGFTDALENDSTLFAQQKAVETFKAKQAWNKTEKEERLWGPNRDAGQRYLDSLKADTTIIRTESGLMYKVLTQGDGEVPQKSDKVLVNYEGRLIDGTVFDASAKHGDKPSTFRPSQVIKGWTEALTMMPVGSKWQLYIPYNLAYGNREQGEIKPYSALIFDVELVGIDKPQTEQTNTVTATPANTGKAKPASKRKGKK